MSDDNQAEMVRLRAMLKILFDNNPDGVCIGDKTGRLTVNPAGIAMLPSPDASRGTVAVTEWSEAYGLFMADGKTPHPAETLPLARALLKGETVLDHELFCRTRAVPQGRWLSINALPLPDGSAIAVFRDISERKKLEETLAQRNEELAGQMQENNELIERLRVALDELSTPVLELGDDILALPVIGMVDTVRSARMTEKVLSEIVARRSRFVIIDITGVDVVDTSTADRFIKLAHAVELLGAECVISGVQPAVAQTLTSLGVSFRGLTTQRNLKRALDHCLARRQGARRGTAA